MEEYVEQGADDDVIAQKELLRLHNIYSRTNMNAKKFTQKLINYGYIMTRQQMDGSRMSCIKGYTLIAEKVCQLEEDWLLVRDEFT